MGNCQHNKTKKVQDPVVVSETQNSEKIISPVENSTTEISVKLAVFGLDDAGKTTIAKQLQCESIDLVAPTVGFSRAEIEIPTPFFTAKSSAAKNNKELQGVFKNVKRTLVIYDLGGGARIRDIWKNYLAEIHGAVFVLDASNTERIAESRIQFDKLLAEPSMKSKPVLLFANKQDKPSPKQLNDLVSDWGLKELAASSQCTIETFECVAIGDKMDERITKGLRWLLGAIEKDFVALNNRVQLDWEEQKQREEEDKKARRERVRKVREERERVAREQAEANGATVQDEPEPEPEPEPDKMQFSSPFQPIETLITNKSQPVESSEKNAEPLSLSRSGPVVNEAYKSDEIAVSETRSETESTPAVRTLSSPPPASSRNGGGESDAETENDVRPGSPGSTGAPSTARKKQKGGMRNIFKRARVGSIAMDADSSRAATPQPLPDVKARAHADDDDEGHTSDLDRPTDEE